MDEGRREWSASMRAEFDAAAPEGRSLSFATGCLVAAWREMLTREEGRYTLTNYALALGVMIPMAALQIGCALFGLPYLYPGREGLRSEEHTSELQSLMRSSYAVFCLKKKNNTANMY